MGKTIFLYGPQTSGKTTRLLRIIERDLGLDVLMSGEDRNVISNGHDSCKVSLGLPREWNTNGIKRFKQRAREELPAKHVLIDGVQFLSKAQIVTLVRVFEQLAPKIPIILAGCLYYVSSSLTRPHNEIPVSYWLLKACDRAVSVDRECDFCDRTANRLFIHGFKRLGSRKIVAIDPHLVCDFHYHWLMNHDHKPN